ncbi:ArgS-related anticodon-binding protein NrtL [Streptomyces sp. NBC_00370]|uniref:ArgS-related anticodon-binding protein NrtL n=1 Tax=Streptomyces sp. NBC_00370 TaxID=2975728 RepID=UPI002E26C59B
MTPAQLARTVRHAVCRAVADGALRVAVPERVQVERPRAGGSGDWATNAALTLAGPAGRAPREVAEILRSRMETRGITRVEITGPGFLNFTLTGDSGADLVRTVLAAGTLYGHGDTLADTTATKTFAPGDGVRATIWTGAVVALLRAQGASADVRPGGEALTVVPVPAGDDVVARLGPDAARWGLLRAAAHDRPLTGQGLLVQRETNPLFLVRYAHARTRALSRAAAELGVPEGDAHGRTPETGAELLAAIGDHPAVLESAARLRAPDRLARHLELTADAVLRFQETGRPLPVGDEKPSAAHRSRVALAEAAGAVLAGGLSLLGITAPEHL